MSDVSPFHPQSAHLRKRMMQAQKATLHKLVPGKYERIIIPNSPDARVLMPVHFGRGMTQSRVCRCSSRCRDCVDEIPLSIHLYIGAYMANDGTKVLIALGTAIPKRWEKHCPYFTHPFMVGRATAHSPIILTEQEHIVIDPNAFPSWDCAMDVAAIFAGRGSELIPAGEIVSHDADDADE